jgi:hypothetical protein
MNNIVYINTVVSYQKKNTISVLLYRVKLNNLGHINITSLMKRLKGRGEGGVTVDFFLRPARKFPGFPVDIPEIS